MKENHLFLAPDIAHNHFLPEDEAMHAIRVLRLTEGDDLWVTDGKGNFFDCKISMAVGGKHPQCGLDILAERSWQQPWKGKIHIAMAPTKMMERVEWLAEKATEIGLNELTFLECDNSERKKMRIDRIERIVVGASKQSHKAIVPVVNDLQRFKDFIAQEFEGQKFIAHCYNQEDIASNGIKEFLFDQLLPTGNALILIGPEGDFSIKEVRMAESAGFQSVSLGKSRLRTETAALIATQLSNLKKSQD